jgi:hypothetical protein
VVVQKALAQNHEKSVMRFTLEALGLFATYIGLLALTGGYTVVALTSGSVLVECYLLGRTFVFLRRAA